MKKIVLVMMCLLMVTAGCRASRNAKGVVVYTLSGRYLETNTYIVAERGEAVVIDPASEGIIPLLERENLKPVYILLTHGHFDHIAELAALHAKYPEVKILVHPDDGGMLSDAERNLSAFFGLPTVVRVPWEPLHGGDRLLVGAVEIEVIATPGHSPGSVCFRVGERLFTGDTLFKGGMGRTDFPGGNAQQLAESLDTLFRLPGDLLIYPGHGETSTLEEEKNR